MKREALKELGMEDETIDKIMSMYGESVNKVRGEVDNFKSELEKANEKIKEFSSVKSELDKIKKESMTKEELAEQKIKDAEAKERDYARKVNALEAKEILISAGLDPEKASGLTANLVKDSLEETISAAKLFADTLTETREATEKKTKEDLSNLDVKPNPADANTAKDEKKVTKEDFNKMSYDEILKLKQSDPETFESLIK